MLSHEMLINLSDICLDVSRRGSSAIMGNAGFLDGPSDAGSCSWAEMSRNAAKINKHPNWV